LIHLKLHKSEVARRVDAKSFRVTKNIEKTLVFNVYTGCNGEGHICMQDNIIIGHLHEGKSIETLEYEDVRSLEFERKLQEGLQ
jgi:hypothetical protein